MRTWLEGLRLWHTINEAPWHGGSALKATLKGAGKFAPPSSHQAKREPVTIDHLRVLHHRLDMSDAFDIAIFAIACIAFWCCCRLGELMLDSQHDPRSHVSCATDIKRGVASNNLNYITFTLPHTKTKEEGEAIHTMDTLCICSPTSSLKHHLQASTNIPHHAPLFAFETSDGSWSPM